MNEKELLWLMLRIVVGLVLLGLCVMPLID